MKIHLIKRAGVLLPATPQDEQLLSSVSHDDLLSIEIKKKRNAKRHRKFFAMLNIGFEAFEPPEQWRNGMPVQKSFDRFRKDVVIAAGFYDVVSNINGDVRAEAKSISFASMDEEEFNQVYNACCNVLLQRVLRNYTRDDLDRVVDELIRF